MNRPDEVNLELGPDDQRVLDALADVGYDVDRLPRVDRARGQRIAELLALLEDYPVDDADDTLVHATLAGIDRHESQRLARMSFDHHQEEAAAADRGRRIRIPDFISVAAVLLIGAAIFWPTLSQVRQRSLATACSNNLRQLGYGFSQYAAANAGAMPVARAGSDLSWDMVANVLNLAPLLDGGYCERGHLSCPAVHEHDAVTGNYSYQWQLPGTRVQWGGGPGMT
ncbi:MAG: hypothetical protein KJO43_08155, partial [Phycisphaerae bacterium]|nr:hypothetical protein [Phycisphaerae bacterium]